MKHRSSHQPVDGAESSPAGNTRARVLPVPATKSCAFCAIVDRTTPAHVVLDADELLGFLDARPLFPGHTLLIPKAHHVTLPELPAGLVGPLFSAAQRLATAMVDGLGAAGSFVAVNNTVSQSVPHLHVHVVPRNRKDGLRGFFWPRTTYDDDEHAAAVARRLRDALDG
ncbi:MAG: HIT family protein [Actinobacteria bacterium]|nr:HIT family protein [Actinomycetota bacterium]